jgi:hypothetical protein
VPKLASTVARLQAGETGEGRIVNEIRKRGIGDADYQQAIALFVAEEGRHARILGRALEGLGGEPHRDHWTARYFTVGRRVLGPRTKIVVLLAAEVIATTFYDAMERALPEGPLRTAFAQIQRDEMAHLEFHTDFFASQDAAGRAAFRAAWWPIASVCCAVVLGDHAATLGALGIDRVALLRAMRAAVTHVDRRVAGATEARWFAPRDAVVADALASEAWT